MRVQSHSGAGSSVPGRRIRSAALLVALLTGPAAAQSPAPRAAEPQEPSQEEAMAQLQAQLTACREQYAAVDARVDAAGVRDAGFHRVPGFPYMRSDRLIASFRHDLRDAESLDAFTLQLRENDGIGRDIELTNLGLPRVEVANTLTQLRLCAVWLNNIELSDAVTLNRLVEAVAIPSEVPAVMGGGPRLPEIAPTPAQAQVLHWQARASGEAGELPRGFRKVLRDGLGRIGLVMSSWRALIEQHAPTLVIVTAGDYDRPGLPDPGARPTVDAAQPVVHYLPSFARVNGRTLVQLNYFIWFSERPALVAGDAEAGALDGLIWRVTLDEDGRPLVYDTATMSGAHHQWFPAQALKARAGTRVAGPAPEGPLALHLASGSHAVIRLATRDAAVTAASGLQYDLRMYEDLQVLKDAQGHSRSLFGPDGVVPGSERAHASGLWPAGLVKPGAVRQWGRHLVSFADALYFDDPALLERSFEVSPPAASLARLESRVQR